MSFVFLVDTNRQPLSPVHPGRARLLLKAGKAAVLKRYPFTLILKTAIEQPQVQPLRLKLDPGSRTTGIAIVDDESGQVLFAAELAHRSQAIKKALEERRTVRRRRRARHSRYRKPRFQNRSKPKAKHFSHLFHTGDIVKAVVPAHLKNPGVHTGRVSVKAKGAFTISTTKGKVTDIGKKYCQVLQKADGYGYMQKGEAVFPPVP